MQQPVNGLTHPQMHHAGQMHPPQASPLDSQGGHSPTSSNASQTPQTTPTSSSGHTPSGSKEAAKICARPGCTNPVQRTPEGWPSDFCSNECVVGQCREVYTSWSSSTQQQHQPQHHHAQQQQQQQIHAQQGHNLYASPQQQQPPVVATAAVK